MNLVSDEQYKMLEVLSAAESAEGMPLAQIVRASGTTSAHVNGVLVQLCNKSLAFKRYGTNVFATTPSVKAAMEDGTLRIGTPEELSTLARRIGRKLAKCRRERRWTQDDLGDRIGISGSVLGYYEVGQRLMPARLLRLCAYCLNIPVEYFEEAI